jgi:hypothetical protein
MVVYATVLDSETYSLRQGKEKDRAKLHKLEEEGKRS